MNFFRKQRPTRTDFEAIVAEYERQLIAYAARITGSHSLAEDIVQEAFIKLAHNWQGELAPSPQVSAWLYKVAHNAAIDHLRHVRRHKAIEKIITNEREIAEEESAENKMSTAETADTVRAALAALNARDRSIVILKIYEEKSYKEIAEIAGISVNNVGFILNNAMKKLAKIITENRGGEGI